MDLGLRPYLAPVNGAAVTVGLPVSFRISVFVFFGLELLDRRVVLRPLHTVSHGGCTSLRSRHLRTRLPLSLLYVLANTRVVVLLTLAVLAGVR